MHPIRDNQDEPTETAPPGEPAAKNDITIGENPDAKMEGEGDPNVPVRSENVIPQVEGAIVPPEHGSIPSTEGRTASMDDHLAEKTTPDSDTGTGAAQFQEPDPLVLGGRAWDVAGGADKMAAARDASSTAGEHPVDPLRNATSPADATLGTLPVGATPQPGAPAFDEPDYAALELTREIGRARRLPGDSRIPGDGTRDLAPRPQLAGSPDPRVTPTTIGAPRVPLPQYPVDTPSAAHEDLHAKVAARAAVNAQREPSAASDPYVETNAEKERYEAATGVSRA